MSIYFQPMYTEHYPGMESYEVYRDIATAVREHPSVRNWTVIQEGEIENMVVLDEIATVPKPKVAKLVLMHLMVRVIVNNDATEDAICEAARRRALHTIANNPIGDHVEEIYDDTDVPATQDEALT